MSLRSPRPFLASALVLLAAPFVVEGCLDDAPSSTSSDAGPLSDERSKLPSPCSVGRTRWVTLADNASSGELVAFGDCLDAGTIPPIAKEGDCQLEAPSAFDPARATRSYVEHGLVRAEQAASSLAVEVASGDVKAAFSSKLASAQPVRFKLGVSAAHDAEELEVVAPTAVAFTLRAGASRAQGIAVEWQGGKPGETLEVVLRADSTGSGRVLRCSGDAGKGQLTVAPSLLAEWPSGEFPLEVVTVTKTQGTDGSTRIWVRARAAATGTSTVTF